MPELRRVFFSLVLGRVVLLPSFFGVDDFKDALSSRLIDRLSDLHTGGSPLVKSLLLALPLR